MGEVVVGAHGWGHHCKRSWLVWLCWQLSIPAVKVSGLFI